MTISKSDITNWLQSKSSLPKELIDRYKLHLLNTSAIFNNYDLESNNITHPDDLILIEAVVEHITKTKQAITTFLEKKPNYIIKDLSFKENVVYFLADYYIKPIIKNPELGLSLFTAINTIIDTKRYWPDHDFSETSDIRRKSWFRKLCIECKKANVLDDIRSPYNSELVKEVANLKDVLDNLITYPNRINEDSNEFIVFKGRLIKTIKSNTEMFILDHPNIQELLTKLPSDFLDRMLPAELNNSIKTVSTLCENSIDKKQMLKSMLVDTAEDKLTESIELTF